MVREPPLMREGTKRHRRQRGATTAEALQAETLGSEADTSSIAAARSERCFRSALGPGHT
jgi:hypothetical protein